MTEKQNSEVDELMSEMERERPRKFSSEELTIFTSNFQTKLGFGAFGDVFKGVFPDGRQVAVKVLKNTMTDFMDKQFMSEVGTMGRTYHENLIKLYGYCFEVNMKALVYQYMENGSFDRILYENYPHIKWVDLYEIAIKIAKGLSFLHGCSPQIIHHDIKPANVLLDSKLCPKITDFGLAKLNKDLSHFAQTGYRGTPGYAAPEVSMNNPLITCKCDVYSFGIMLFDILRRKRNSEGEEWFPVQVWVHLQNGQLDKIIMECGIGEEDKEDVERLSKVALLCAQFNSQVRPSMSTVVAMLEGEIPPWMPKDNPFPYYDSSSDSSTRRSRRGSTRMVSPTYDERLQGNVVVSSHGSSSEAREPELIQGAFLNTQIVHDQRNKNQIQKYERSSDKAKAPKSIQMPINPFSPSPIQMPINPFLPKIPIVNPQKDNAQRQNNERLYGNVPVSSYDSSSDTEEPAVVKPFLLSPPIVNPQKDNATKSGRDNGGSMPRLKPQPKLRLGRN